MRHFLIFLFTLVFHCQTQADDLIVVTDYINRTIELEKPASRIVALSPHIVENIFSAGAGEQLVGVVDYSNYPPHAQDLVNVGSSMAINLETLVALQPDLVIAWGSGTSQHTLSKLTQLGFKVYIDEPSALSDIAKSIRDIGRLTGNSNIADQVTDNFMRQISQISSLYQGATKIDVFYQVWNKPLQTINGKHIINSVIELCGGRNIYAGEPSIAPVINIESILDRDPEVIIASGTNKNRPAWLDDWQQWNEITAVGNNHLFSINPDHIQRHSLRLLLGIDALCSHLEAVRNQYSD